MKPLATAAEMGTGARRPLHDAERARSERPSRLPPGRRRRGRPHRPPRGLPARSARIRRGGGCTTATEPSPEVSRALRPSAMPGAGHRVGRRGIRARVRGGRPPPDPRPSARRAAHVRQPHHDPRRHPALDRERPHRHRARHPAGRLVPGWRARGPVRRDGGGPGRPGPQRLPGRRFPDRGADRSTGCWTPTSHSTAGCRSSAT